MSDIHDNPKLRGYWKLNNTLLKDQTFYDSILKLIKELFTNLNGDYKKTWEFFKYKARYIAVKRSKEILKSKHQTDSELINNLMY